MLNLESIHLLLIDSRSEDLIRKLSGFGTFIPRNNPQNYYISKRATISWKILLHQILGAQTAAKMIADLPTMWLSNNRSGKDCPFFLHFFPDFFGKGCP